MAKKKRKAGQEPQTIANIHFDLIDYEILKLSYGYTFTQNPDFQLSVTVKVADELFKQAFTVAAPISTILPLIAKKNAAMAQYVQKTIDSFDDPHFQEELAFKALEEEGFDFHHFARCALAEMDAELFWDPDLPPPPQQVKIVKLGDIDYTIIQLEISYGNKEPPVFTFHVSVQLPKHILDRVITILMPLYQVMEDVEKKDVAMANYVKKALADNQNEPNHETYTIQSLAEEGFDLHLFLRYALTDFAFQIEKK